MTQSMRHSVGFINPGSLGDRLPRQGLAQAGSTQLMGWPKSLKTTGQKGGPVTDQKVWPRRNSARLSTPAHFSDRSSHFGLQTPPDGLSDRKAWQSTTSDSDPMSPTEGYAKTLLTALLRLAQPEPTGTNRLGTPVQKEPGNKRRKARQGT